MQPNPLSGLPPPPPTCATPAMLSITRLGTLVTDLGECPTWHAGQLWLLDCRRGLVLALDPADGRVCHSLSLPAPLGSFAWDESGCLLVALKEQLVALDPQTGAWAPLAQLDVSHPQMRLNDGCALPDGSFVVGTKHPLRAPGEAPLGGIYRLGHDLRLRRLGENVGIANGPAVSPSNGRFHMADSEARSIHSWALLPDGSLGDRRLFVDTAAWGSGPDGCCFDDEGGLWTALVRASALARFSPEGALTHWLALPLTYPSAVCFGGPSMDTLYVSSIRDSGRLRADGPLDGAVLQLTGTGFRGPGKPQTRLGLAAALGR